MAPSEVAKRLRKGAGKGSSEGQLRFGLLHYRGREGVKKDLPTAAEWIRKAAMQGLAGAQSWLGNLHMTGDGVERDMEQAVVWRRKAASQNPESYDKYQGESILNARRNLTKAYDDGGEGGSHKAPLFSSTLCS
jgi:TPR repeat protein